MLFIKSILHILYLLLEPAAEYSLNWFPPNLVLFPSTVSWRHDASQACFLSQCQTAATGSCFTRYLNCVVSFHFPTDIISLSHFSHAFTFVAPFRTMQRLIPPSCEAKQTLHVWRASGQARCMWYRCGHGLWLDLANTAVRCASKLSQMVRITEAGETDLSVSL